MAGVGALTRLMAEHLRHGEPREALRVQRRMREGGVKPEAFALVAALKACVVARDAAAGKEVHARAIAAGHISDVFVGSALVDMYAKCGSVADARRAFDRMPRRTAVSWNAMIMGYAQAGMGAAALQLFQLMQEQGLSPTPRTFLAALMACSSLAEQHGGRGVDAEAAEARCLRIGRALHAQLTRHGFASDRFIASALVGMYARCGSASDARQAFESIPYRSVVVWNAMIMGYAHLGMGDPALRSYARMRDEGFVPNARTYIAMLKACASTLPMTASETSDELPKARCLEVCKAVHAQIISCGVEPNLFLASTLVDIYEKCGSMADACWVLENTEHRHAVLWTSVIMGYARRGEGELALRSYARMQQEGFRPDAHAFVAALKACACLAAHEVGKQVDGKALKLRGLEHGRAVHSQVMQGGFESDLFIASALVDFYAKCGSIADARRVFDRTCHRNVILWNAMITGYAEMEMGETALKLYARLQAEGISPDARTYVAALKACGSLPSLGTGKGIHAQVRRARLSGDAFVANSLLDMYCKCGSMADAWDVFESLSARNVVAWNSLMAGYSGQGKSNCVLGLFERMQQEGVRPDGVTFVSVLAACSRTGSQEAGLTCFRAMCLEYGISPASEHHSCMVDLLGRAGRVDDAVAAMKKMPFQPGATSWVSVLSACQKWDTVETGRHAFECAARSNEARAAACALMNNISARANLLRGAFEVREL